MGSPPILPFALTGTTSSLTSYEQQIEYPSPPSPESGPLVASPLESLYVLDGMPHMYGWQHIDVQFHPGSSLAQPYLHPGQDENTFLLPSNHILNQHMRNGSGLLDTRQWSPLPTLSTLYATSRSHFPSMAMESHWHASPHVSFAHVGAPAHIAREPQVIPDLGSSLLNSTTYHHPSPGTINLTQPTCLKSTVSASTSPPALTEDTTNFCSSERQPATAIYRSPQKKGPGRRRFQRACAIKIGEVWIDKEDLRSGANRDNSMIHIHECWWAQSSNPCGMWIIGSKPHVSAHILKWHRQEHVDSTAVKRRCLWDGCTTSKAMRKDSTSRHIITVHLGEEFHCQGCDKEFPRMDVYDKHVQNDEVCRDAGAAIVYGAEHREIDARQALQQTGADVRYADQ